MIIAKWRTPEFTIIQRMRPAYDLPTYTSKLDVLHESRHTATMPFLDGRGLAAELRTKIRERITDSGLTPTLAVLLIGNDPASHLYVSLKERAATEVGARVIRAERSQLGTEEAIRQIQTWNMDPNIHGILVQLPLPAGMDTDAVIAAIDPKKDVDSFHPINREALMRGEGNIFSPVHLATLRLLASSPLHLNGARMLVLAKSTIFRQPLVHLLQKAGAFVDAQNELPRDLATYSGIITALGHPAILEGGALHPNAVIIDISTNALPDGATVGDVAINTLLPTQYASPVPGGVGPLTIAYLLQNLVERAETLVAQQ